MSTSALQPELQQADRRKLAYCALLLIAALYVVGAVSNGIVRHVVQTAPLGPTVVLGMKRSDWSKWTALPCFLFWLFMMALIWLFLLGWIHVISGTFSAVEIAMTLVVGASSSAGIFLALRTPTRARTRGIGRSTVFLLILAVQLFAFRISFLPALAHDHWR